MAEEGNWDRRRPQGGKLLACECKLKSQERDRQKRVPGNTGIQGLRAKVRQELPERGVHRGGSGRQGRRSATGDGGWSLGRSLSRGQGALDESSCGGGGCSGLKATCPQEEEVKGMPGIRLETGEGRSQNWRDQELSKRKTFLRGKWFEYT